MEYDKIKIYVTKRVAEILEKDAETFEFLKKDGITPNKNALLTTLIVNYWKSFRQKQADLNNLVKKVLRENTSFGDEKIQNLSSLISNKVNKEIASDLVDKFDRLISLKPTKESQPIIDYIEEYLLDNCSLSEYFRNMFVAYTALPQDMREEIIFKPQYTLLSEAINSHKRVFVHTKGFKQNRFEIQPYLFSRSKEEMHIYLLYKNHNTCKSIKLSRIMSVTILDKSSQFTEAEVRLFDKMIKCGAQFSYNLDEKEIVVKLTPKGQVLFHKIYVHRPIPSKIDGNILTFSCSYVQVIQYFSRFGGEVEIISPKFVKDAIFNFHNSYIKSIKNN